MAKVIIAKLVAALGNADFLCNIFAFFMALGHYEIEQIYDNAEFNCHFNSTVIKSLETGKKSEVGIQQVECIHMSHIMNAHFLPLKGT